MTTHLPHRSLLSKRLIAGIGAPLLTIGTLAAAALAPVVSAQTTTMTVNCDAGDSLATAVTEAQPGATIEVTGTCEESVLIPRTVNNVVIDGGDQATVLGPDADAPPTGPESFTFFIEGQGITLQGINIVGGAHGVHLSGPASATIVDNTITDSGGAIHLDKDSTGQIAGNTITGNAGYGINIQENSYARIGFTAPTRGHNGNTITDNDGPGIVIKQWSTGWISGNTISGNQGHGVLVDRSSLGEVYDNTIEANTGDGIRVTNGSGLSLNPEGAEAPSQIAGNRSETPNGGTGISCEIGGYVSGDSGSITGQEGQSRFAQGCENALTGANDSPTHGSEATSLFTLSS